VDAGEADRGQRQLALPTTAPVAFWVAELKKLQIRNPDMNRTANQGTLLFRKKPKTRLNTAR
jgi:hypothetical protein